MHPYTKFLQKWTISGNLLQFNDTILDAVRYRGLDRKYILTIMPTHNAPTYTCRISTQSGYTRLS